MAARLTDKLVRPVKGRIIGGVCVGIAGRFGVNVALIRVIWIFLLIPGGFPGFLSYVLLWIVIPSEK